MDKRKKRFALYTKSGKTITVLDTGERMELNALKLTFPVKERVNMFIQPVKKVLEQAKEEPLLT